MPPDNYSPATNPPDEQPATQPVAPITNPIADSQSVALPTDNPSPMPDASVEAGSAPASSDIVPPASTSPFIEKSIFKNQSSTNQQLKNPILTTAQSSQSEPTYFDDVDSNFVAVENIYTEICSQIVREQEKIIGSLAIEQANQVAGLIVNPTTYHCTVVGDGSRVINSLVEQYRNFFGHAAVEVCKEAAARFINRLPVGGLPSLLR